MNSHTDITHSKWVIDTLILVNHFDNAIWKLLTMISLVSINDPECVISIVLLVNWFGWPGWLDQEHYTFSLLSIELNTT